MCCLLSQLCWALEIYCAGRGVVVVGGASFSIFPVLAHSTQLKGNLCFETHSTGQTEFHKLSAASLFPETFLLI